MSIDAKKSTAQSDQLELHSPIKHDDMTLDDINISEKIELEVRSKFQK